MGDGIDEAVVLLVAANFAHQEAGVHDQAGDHGSEENYAQEKQHAFAPVENDPADVQPDRQQHQANAQHDEKGDGPAAAVMRMADYEDCTACVRADTSPLELNSASGDNVHELASAAKCD